MCMTPTEQFEKVNYDLNLVMGVIKKMEAEGIDPRHEVFDMLAERVAHLLNSFYVLFEQHPELRYRAGDHHINKN